MLRNQDLPKQSSCISKLMVLLYCTYQFWLVPWSVALVSQTTRDDVYHITCIDLWIFFFHYSIMYYNMYCYHVASIHNQSWTGLLIMETVDQSVSCNLVGVFFFSISMQSFIVQLSEIRNFMISFVITSKYLHVYDKEIFDLKPMGHAFTCHIGIIKSVHIYYCTHVYMYRYLKKKKVHFECVYESQIMSQLYRGWYSLWPNLWPLFFIGGLWTTRGNGERWLSHGNSKVQYL